MFTNNKGGVGKTTTAFNVAKKFASNGYKTVLIDLDSQCNLSRLALGEDFFEDDELKDKDIFAVLKGVISGRADVDFDVKFTNISENLSILPGNIELSEFESVLSSSYNEASGGKERGFFVSSAIDRFLKKKGLYEEIDLFIIDTNPSLSQLNKTIFLGVNYFIVPMNPDAFNHQGIKNLGIFFERERKNWELSGKIIGQEKEISSSELLNGEAIFLGYIINSYNVYNKKPIYSQNKRIERLPKQIKENLSYKHGRNGLVDISYKEPIGYIQDYGQLSTLSQENKKAIFELTEEEAKLAGTIENLNKSKEEFENIYKEILQRLNKW